MNTKIKIISVQTLLVLVLYSFASLVFPLLRVCNSSVVVLVQYHLSAIFAIILLLVSPVF